MMWGHLSDTAEESMCMSPSFFKFHQRFLTALKIKSLKSLINLVVGSQDSPSSSLGFTLTDSVSVFSNNLEHEKTCFCPRVFVNFLHLEFPATVLHGAAISLLVPRSHVTSKEKPPSPADSTGLGTQQVTFKIC